MAGSHPRVVPCVCSIIWCVLALSAACSGLPDSLSLSVCVCLCGCFSPTLGPSPWRPHPQVSWPQEPPCLSCPHVFPLRSTSPGSLTLPWVTSHPPPRVYSPASPPPVVPLALCSRPRVSPACFIIHTPESGTGERGWQGGEDLCRGCLWLQHPLVLLSLSPCRPHRFLNTSQQLTTAARPVFLFGLLVLVLTLDECKCISVTVRTLCATYISASTVVTHSDG